MSDFKFSIGEKVRIIQPSYHTNGIGVITNRAASPIEEGYGYYAVQTHGINHSKTNEGNILFLPESALRKQTKLKQETFIGI